MNFDYEKYQELLDTRERLSEIEQQLARRRGADILYHVSKTFSPDEESELPESEADREAAAKILALLEESGRTESARLNAEAESLKSAAAELERSLGLKPNQIAEIVVKEAV